MGRRSRMVRVTEVPTMVDDSAPGRLTFRARHRLAHSMEFDRVFKAKATRHLGALSLFAKPNQRPHFRLGLSVPRRVGSAVDRHLIKRRLREAFRVHQHELPGAPDGGGYDFVVAVRPHAVKDVEAYARELLEAAAALDRLWRKRAGQGSV